MPRACGDMPRAAQRDAQYAGIYRASARWICMVFPFRLGERKKHKKTKAVSCFVEGVYCYVLGFNVCFGPNIAHAFILGG